MTVKDGSILDSAVCPSCDQQHILWLSDEHGELFKTDATYQFKCPTTGVLIEYQHPNAVSKGPKGENFVECFPLTGVGSGG